MSETTPDTIPDTPDETPDQPQESPAPAKRDEGLFPAPEDVATEVSTGYAVYNRTLGQYAPGVSPDKPTAKDAKARVPEGHKTAIVRV